MKNAHHLKSIGITVSHADLHTLNVCSKVQEIKRFRVLHVMLTAESVQVSNVEFERQPIADHANQLAAGIQQNLKRSLEGLGVVCHQLHSPRLPNGAFSLLLGAQFPNQGCGTWSCMLICFGISGYFDRICKADCTSHNQVQSSWESGRRWGGDSKGHHAGHRLSAFRASRHPH